MSYQYDLSDFKRYLNRRNTKNRVDGLVFWQYRLPVPIEIFHRIFSDSDLIVSDYISHLVASVLVSKHSEEFAGISGMSAAKMPSRSLLDRLSEVEGWLEDKLTGSSVYAQIAVDAAGILGVEGFVPDPRMLGSSLSHHGKKYDRLHIPAVLRSMVEKRVGDITIGISNTDMIGNVIADRYDIYRSSFGDALAIIFNMILDFRIVCEKSSSSMRRLDLTIENTRGVDIRFGRTANGSLWELSYDEDHFAKINEEPPLLRDAPEVAMSMLAELLYYMVKSENNQYPDSQRKMQDNLRP